MRHKNFFDIEHARAYLSGSFIRIRDRVAHVDTVNAGRSKGEYQLVFEYVGDRATPRVVNYPSPEVDFNPFPMGWYAKKRGKEGWQAFYLSRLPSRGWKVGLTPRVLNVQRLGVTSSRYQAVDPQDILWTQEFDKTVRGEYEPYEKVYSIISRSKTAEIPFSRRFCTRQGQLFYRFFDEPVGVPEKTGPVLLPDYQYLEEALREDLR